jgi:hypothetical protein
MIVHPGAMRPLMSADEQGFLREYLTERSRVLEWGSGGSTVHFSPACLSWLSIEHHHEWAARVQAAVPADGRVSLLYVPPDRPVIPILDDSKGYTKGYEEAFDSYAQAALSPAAMAAGGENGFDVIVIDGRARLFCALLCLKHDHLKRATILFHDFRPRPRYWPILNHCEVIGSVETGRTMVALRAREPVNELRPSTRKGLISYFGF